MQWRDAFAILLGVLLVVMVIRSMFNQWGGNKDTPIRGRLKAASEWLEENGYQIQRVRQKAEWAGYYDAREYKKQMIADFIVRKGARTYVVKVMSARDQGMNGHKLRADYVPLIEAFGVQGVLQIDMEKEDVHEIDSSLKSPSFVLWRRVLNRALWMLGGALLALMWFRS